MIITRGLGSIKNYERLRGGIKMIREYPVDTTLEFESGPFDEEFGDMDDHFLIQKIGQDKFRVIPEWLEVDVRN